MGLYNFLEGLIIARYTNHKEKLTQLEKLNGQLDILRYQTRLLLDFQLISQRHYQYVSNFFNEIGKNLGAWIKHQQKK
jgi:hypothetical protein